MPLDIFSLSAAILDAVQQHPEEASYPRDLRNVIEEAIKAFLAPRSQSTQPWESVPFAPPATGRPRQNFAEDSPTAEKEPHDLSAGVEYRQGATGR